MEQLPVKLWDTASGVPYFLLVKFCANEADFERSTFDIEATDGTVRWSVEGLARPAERDKWTENVHKALTEPGQGQYEYQFTKSGSQLKLIIRWKQENMSGRVRADIVLPQAEQAGGMQGFLTLLFDDFAALQKAHTESSSQAELFKQEADQFRVISEQFAREKEKLEVDGDFLTKFAAVLNQKKLQLREQRDRCAQLEERLQRAQEGGDDTESRSEGGGSRGTAEESNRPLSGDTAPSGEDEAASLPQRLDWEADSLQQQGAQQGGEGGSAREPDQAAAASGIKQEPADVGASEQAALLEAPKQSLEAGAAADADMDAQAVTKREDSGTQEAVQPRKATQMAKRRRR